MILLSIFTLLFAYLLGSVSSGIICSKIMRLPDPRSDGSKNPGATNVLRLGGKKAAIITLLGDSIKAVIPVLLAKLLGLNAYIIGFVGLAAFLGHIYPIYYKFKGGKGVATTFGALIALHWLLGLVAIVIWLIMAVIFRYSSLAALTVALFAPVYLLWFGPEPYLIPVLIMCVLLIFKHYSNIRRLIAGTESKIGQSS